MKGNGSPLAGSGGVSGNERHRVRSYQEEVGGLYINERQRNALM